MRRWARRAGIAVAVLLLLFAAAAIFTARPSDPALWPPRAGDPTINIFVVSNGYHTGVALPRAALAELAGNRGHAALIAVTQRFGAFEWIEFGWGDREFYRSVPTAADVQVPMALRALFHPGNPSVVHVVGLNAEPARVFASAEIVSIPLSTAGLVRMVARLEGSFAPPQNGTLADVGRGLYGPSLFYPANGTFSILRLCNHWVDDLLAAAGLPATPVLATVPTGLMLALRWRAGLSPMQARSARQ